MQIFLVHYITMDFLQEYHLYLNNNSYFKHLIIQLNLLRIATTLSSFNISIEPREIKYNDVKISPRCVIISPGGACVVLNFIENVRKQPSLASKT
jgi:hypothetical protein